jgi:hypothetical protein
MACALWSNRSMRPGRTACWIGAVFVAAILCWPPAAGASSQVTIQVSGAGTVAATPGNFGGACVSPLSTPTGTVGQTCVGFSEGTFVPSLGGGFRIVTLTATTSGDWSFDGWAVAQGPAGCAPDTPATTCVLGLATCTDADPDHCTYFDLSVRAAFKDVQAPDTAIGSKPASTTVATDGQATFTFSSPDPVATFRCKLDTEPSFTPCVSPRSYAVTQDGPHAFAVKAVDPSGNEDSSPATWPWLHLIRPDTTITSGPPQGAVLADPGAAFGLSSSKAASTFECRLDAQGWKPCANPATYEDLPEGLHRFAARARNGFLFEDVTLLYEDLTPAERSWTVDVTSPDTSFANAPDEGLLTNSRSASFALASEPGARFECSLDDAPFAACPADVTVARLALGAHRFTARAIDAAGNADPTPAARRWSVTADLDGDGFVLPTDCDDADPAIHPGARDVPEDGSDQDCSGRDARFRALRARVRTAYAFLPDATHITSLTIERVPAGATIRISCRAGRGSCPLDQRIVRSAKAKRRLTLTRMFRGARLHQGTIVAIRITKPERLGLVTRLTMRDGRLPKRTEFCLDPRTAMRARC